METRKLIEKYLSGETTREETAQAIAYLADDQSDLSLLQGILDRYQDNPAISGDAQARDRLLLQLRRRLYPQLAGKLQHTIPGEDGLLAAYNMLNETNTKEGMLVTMQPVKKRWKWWIGAAASVLLVFAGWWLMNLQHTDKPAMEWKLVENNTNRVHSYQLPDGSSLWLHPHSSLYYTAGFTGSSERRVRLEGEGFFDIAHDSTRPFIVQAGRVQTKVLGTAFNLEAYSNENAVRVSLVRGKVAVTDTAKDNTTNTTLLSAGHVLVYHKQQQVRAIDTLLMTNSTQWTDGTMVLHNIPVADALQRVAKRYGLQVRLDKNINLEGKNVNGVFKEQTREEMLHIILFVSGYQYRLTGETIEVFKK